MTRGAVPDSAKLLLKNKLAQFRETPFNECTKELLDDLNELEFIVSTNLHINIEKNMQTTEL